MDLNKIYSKINREELKQMVVDMVNIPSPTGQEEQMGRYVSQKLRSIGMEVVWQEVEEGRPNVVGTLRGDGTGPVLEFDGHLDVSFSGNEEFMFGGASAPVASVRKINGDEWIFGVGSFNMKAALAAYISAAKSIIDSGVKLSGNIVISATCCYYIGCNIHNCTRFLVVKHPLAEFVEAHQGSLDIKFQCFIYDLFG